MRTSADPAAHHVVGGRYRVRRTLKSGLNITTWLADDLVLGGHVVVKACPLPAVGDSAELLLRHEAAVLARIDHPHVAPLLEVGVDRDLLFLTVPAVSGIPLRERLSQGPLGVVEALVLGEALASALGAVAERGVLHRDVKPDNVMVNADGPLREVTLVDFGLSRSDMLEPSLRDVPIGTARYAAPEQTGLVEGGVDHRSDLYSLGCLLFEALAGCPPYEGDRVGDVLRKHLVEPVPSLRSLGAAVPRALDEVVQRLLAKHPRDRYQTAAALVADLSAIRSALESGDADPGVVVGIHDRRCCTLGQPAFVGRSNDLARLDSALDEVWAGRGTVVALEASSGTGKTRLLDEFAQRAAERGAWVLRGHGVDQAAVLPFQTLHGVADAVVAGAGERDMTDLLIAGLGHHATAAVAALPHLAQVLGTPADEMLGPDEHAEARSIAAIATLFDTLGRGDRPAVVLLDDCQWADRVTCRVLAQWRRHAAEGGRARVLVVIASRADEVRAGHPLRDVPVDDRVALAHLGDDDIRRLVESCAGEVDRAGVDAVAELAGGSPFMASAVLHGLVESGALTCEHPGWRLVETDGELLQSSRRAATFLARRLDLLPPATLDLLLAGAVLGKEFELDFAARLAGQAPTTAVLALQEAGRRHLVWSRSQGARCTFVHDRIREALLDRLDPEARRAHHAAAAARFEAAAPDRAFDLAYHFDAAGQPERALPYAVAAAEEARQRSSLDVAERQYRIAARALDHAEPATRVDVLMGLGDVLMLAGRYDEARLRFDEALALTGNRVVEADLQARLAELAFKEGRLDDAASACERGLRLLGSRFPRTTIGFLVEIVRETAAQILHCLMPRWLVARRSLDARSGRDLLAARLYSRYAHVAWFTRGPVQTLWSHLREMNLAERYPPTRELAQAYSEHAPAVTLVGWHGRGIRYAQRSLEIRRELRDVWGQGQSLNFYGIVLYTAGRYQESIDTCTEAVRLLERTGDQWELNIARCHVAYNLYRLGRVGEAGQLAREIHRDGVEIGDRQAAGVSLDVWAKSSDGAVPAELVEAELARRTPDVQLASHLRQADALRLRREGRLLEAVEILDGAVTASDAAGIRNEYVAAARPWVVTVLREAAEQVPLYSARRTRLLRRARRAVRRARRLAWLFPNNRSHVLRERALLALAAGRRRRARTLLRSSLEAARSRGAVQEEYETLTCLERIGAELGWRGTAEVSERLEHLMPMFGPSAGRRLPAASAATLGLLDRFDVLLDEGRRIAGALSEATVSAASVTAMRNLLRAQHCSVVDLRHARLDPDSSDPERAAAWLVETAVRERRPVVLGEAAEEGGQDDADALILAGIRSALCAPIFVRGDAVACLLATHSSVEGLFGSEEVRLAELVAAIAGAALENAQGFSEIEALRRSLEERVTERTEQLSTMLSELERVNAELRDADRMKNDFVSMVSHELRTPLTPIIGLSSTMLQRWNTMDDGLREECLVSIHRQGTRLARLVDDLLEMSRIESGALESHPDVVTVAPLVASTLGALGSDFADVDVRCPAGLQVVADPDRVQQILINYLENARKYGQAPVAVDVRASGDWIEVVVADSGAGVPDEFVDRLFEKFSRAPGTDAAGTGLGLSIVRGLARAQGGDAWYEHNAPTGARFGVRLPRAMARPRHAEASA